MKKQMIDRHYHIRDDQDEALRSLAQRLKRKPAQLVREGIDLVIRYHSAEDNWLEETQKIRGVLEDDTDVEARIAQARSSLDRSAYAPKS